MTATPHVKRRPLERADLERMALPRDYWQVRLPGLPPAAAGVVQNYLARMPDLFAKGVGLFLGGPEGTGKTALASIVAREARVAGYAVYFTTVWDLREALRTRAAFDPENQESVQDRVRTVDLLILDNLRVEDGQQDNPFFSRRALDELLAGRAAATRPTIVTGRFSFPELDNPKGPWRGLLATGRLVFVPVEGPNLRERTLQELRSLVMPPRAGGSR